MPKCNFNKVAKQEFYCDPFSTPSRQSDVITRGCKVFDYIAKNCTCLAFKQLYILFSYARYTFISFSKCCQFLQKNADVSKVLGDNR